MNRLATLAFLLVPFVSVAPVYGQAQHPERSIDFPDVPGYQTLVCDFHIHTVFSDGSVWPDIRVEEALRDGLDCLAVTEHLEYLPHEDDIPIPDHNRSFDLAQEHAAEHDLIVLRGAEVTRSMPPGHANAIFIEDANTLVVDDPVAAFEAVGRQGGFTFWNHPNWTSQRPDGVATLTDMHRQLIDAGLLDGIEVVNDVTYSDEALQIALDHDLVILGTSDIHGLVDWQFGIPDGGHRPVTLVFAEERTAAGIRAALDARRTAVWFDETLIGRREHVEPLIAASLGIASAHYTGDSSVLEIAIENTSDVPFLLRNRSEYTFHDAAGVVTITPQAQTRILVKTVERVDDVELRFEVLNAVVAPQTHPDHVLRVRID